MTTPSRPDQGPSAQPAQPPPAVQTTPPPEEDAQEELREVAHTLDAGWKRRNVVRRDGRSFVLYTGLLDLGHRDGLQEISTTIVQIPSELNGMTAIVHATVVTGRGTFQGLGDASPTNVTRMMAPHLIRMAETRAKARALRDATNVGMTSFEELGEPSVQPDRQDGDREHVDRKEPAWGTPTGGGSGAAPRRVPRETPAPDGPATAEQLAAIARLMVAAGADPKAAQEAQRTAAGLTFEQAGQQIITLQDASRSGARS